MGQSSTIYVAGHNGLVGSAVVRYLRNYIGIRADGFDILTRSHSELDLTNQSAVDDFFKTFRPDYVVLAAAKVGGILANSTYVADFIRDNLSIQVNVIEAARKYGCKKFCFLGSSCIYPRDCQQPIKEEYLLSGPLEKTNEMYALAKIAGVQMIKAYHQQYGFPGYSLMPTNLYGPNDNFDLQNSHVLPALIRKFHEAKVNKSNSVEVWGTGSVKREFLHVDDLARVITNTLLDKDLIVPEVMNVGYGEDLYIHELTSLIKEVIGFNGKVYYDTSKPDGTPKKLLDISKMKKIGLAPTIDLKSGIKLTYDWYLKNKAK